MTFSGRLRNLDQRLRVAKQRHAALGPESPQWKIDHVAKDLDQLRAAIARASARLDKRASNLP